MGTPQCRCIYTSWPTPITAFGLYTFPGSANSVVDRRAFEASCEPEREDEHLGYGVVFVGDDGQVVGDGDQRDSRST
jgi:hypothetical protein